MQRHKLTQSEVTSLHRNGNIIVITFQSHQTEASEIILRKEGTSFGTVNGGTIHVDEAFSLKISDNDDTYTHHTEFELTTSSGDEYKILWDVSSIETYLERGATLLGAI
jgi:hypothetical protein